AAWNSRRSIGDLRGCNTDAIARMPGRGPGRNGWARPHRRRAAPDQDVRWGAVGPTSRITRRRPGRYAWTRPWRRTTGAFVGKRQLRLCWTGAYEGMWGAAASRTTRRRPRPVSAATAAHEHDAQPPAGHDSRDTPPHGYTPRERKRR